MQIINRKTNYSIAELKTQGRLLQYQKVKVKLSLYRPGEALKVPGG
jgi:hypothetical protein